MARHTRLNKKLLLRVIALLLLTIGIVGLILGGAGIPFLGISLLTGAIGGEVPIGALYGVLGLFSLGFWVAPSVINDSALENTSRGWVIQDEVQRVAYQQQVEDHQSRVDAVSSKPWGLQWGARVWTNISGWWLDIARKQKALAVAVERRIEDSESEVLDPVTERTSVSSDNANERIPTPDSVISTFSSLDEKKNDLLEIVILEKDSQTSDEQAAVLEGPNSSNPMNGWEQEGQLLVDAFIREIDEPLEGRAIQDRLILQSFYDLVLGHSNQGEKRATFQKWFSDMKAPFYTRYHPDKNKSSDVTQFFQEFFPLFKKSYAVIEKMSEAEASDYLSADFRQRLAELDKGISELKEGVREYGEGVREYGEGVREYGEGVREYGEGVYELTEQDRRQGEKIEKLGDGIAEINGKLRYLKEQSKEQDVRLAELQRKTDEIDVINTEVNKLFVQQEASILAQFTEFGSTLRKRSQTLATSCPDEPAAFTVTHVNVTSSSPPSSEDDVISASERDTAAFFKIPNVEDPIAASRSISSMKHRSW